MAGQASASVARVDHEPRSGDPTVFRERTSGALLISDRMARVGRSYAQPMTLLRPREEALLPVPAIAPRPPLVHVPA